MAGKHALSGYPGYDESGYENGQFKRQKVEQGSFQQITYSGESGGNPHFTEPSPVVHARGVADEAREPDLLHALSIFGSISCVTMMPKIRQALVEFEDIASARRLMEHTYAGNTIVLCGRPAYFNYSKSKSISRNLQIHHENPVNKILLITVINPQYPVTTDILHTIFSKQGHVLRIVIFRKSGLQAMIEFATIEQAQQAKQTLNGADIYTGCNTLKIEYSRQTTALNVYKNDEETFDYTEDKKVSTGLLRPPVKEGLLSRPVIRPFRGRGGMMMPGPRPPMFPHPPVAGSCVLMVYGLHDRKMNCDRLFNILCCYGNVMKVKFLLNKPGAAMVEMSDHIACNTVIQCLGGQQLFDSNLEFSFSKQKYLVDASSVADLPDGTPCFKSYTESKNHRFWTPQQSSKNRIFSPTKVLHFFNAPPDMTPEKVTEIFSDAGVHVPCKSKVFPEGRNVLRSASGLLEWTEVSQALEGLAVCNHHVIRDAVAKTIFTVKLAFSSMASAN